MSTITISPLNHVHVKLISEAGIEAELWEYFSFKVPGYKHMPAFKSGHWSGDIRLYNSINKKIYKGLIPHVYKFAKDRGYEIDNQTDYAETPISVQEVKEFLKELNLPEKIEVRDYQIESVIHCIRKGRGLLLSPTASGKSFIIYVLIRLYNLRTLLIVPNTGLVHQMVGDFADYSQNDPNWDVDKMTSKIMGGYSKENLNQVVVSTWQSLISGAFKPMKNGKPPQAFREFMSQYDLILVDEAHGAKAKSITGVLEAAPDCEHRFGFTGTLDGTETNKLVLEGLFANAKQIIDTATLIENKTLSALKINCLMLRYNKASRKAMTGEYIDEIKFLVQHPRRNKFIANLAVSLKGNTLVLFRWVETHGKVLHKLIEEKAPPGTKVFFIAGEVSAEERNEIRAQVEASKDPCIIVASEGTTAVGTNIVRLNNMIFASPTKARIRTLQAIGRGLRKGGDKTECTLYDISDDLSKNKNNKNHTLRHFFARLQMYNEQKFDYHIHPIQIEKE